jgi:hypothetical protein
MKIPYPSNQDGVFEVEEKNYSTVSRIIREAIQTGFIKEEDSDNKAKRYSKYLPFWG